MKRAVKTLGSDVTVKSFTDPSLTEISANSKPTGASEKVKVTWVVSPAFSLAESTVIATVGALMSTTN